MARFPRLTLILPLGLALAAIAAPASAMSWSTARTVSQHGAMSHASGLAVSGSTAHLTYVSGLTVAYRRSSNGGANWAAPTTLQPHIVNANWGFPQVAASGKHVVVIYLDEATGAGIRLWSRRSTDGGTTWSPRQLIAHGASYTDLESPSLAVAGAHAFVAWTKGSSGAVRMRRSIDGGAHWAAPRKMAVSNFSLGGSYDGNVHMAASGSRAYLTWIPDRTTEYMGTGIQLRRSSDGGATWKSATTLVGDHLKYAGSITFAASGARIVASYTREGGQVSAASSANGGLSVATENIVTDGSTAANALALSGRVARFISASAAAPLHIDLRTSTDGGVHWSSAQQAASTPDGVSPWGLAIGAGSDGVVFAWQEYDFLATQTAISTRHGD